MADDFLVTFGYIAVFTIGISLAGFGIKAAVDSLKVWLDDKHRERHEKDKEAEREKAKHSYK